MGQRMDIQVGMDVKSREGGRSLGKVIGLADDAFVVERGVFFAHDYRVPFRAVETIEKGSVYLSLNRKQLAEANLGDVLEVTDRLTPSPAALSAARMGTSLEREEAGEGADATRPIGFRVEPATPD
jgi:hypothetical protein